MAEISSGTLQAGLDGRAATSASGEGRGMSLDASVCCSQSFVPVHSSWDDEANDDAILLCKVGGRGGGVTEYASTI